MKYTVKKVYGFTNESGEYTGKNTTCWQKNTFVNGFAVMSGNKVVAVYSRKFVAEMDAKNLNEK